MQIESKQQILKRRREIEKELLEMLKEIKSDFGLDDIKEIIYNEDSQDRAPKPLNSNDKIFSLKALLGAFFVSFPVHMLRRA